MTTKEDLIAAAKAANGDPTTIAVVIASTIAWKGPPYQDSFNKFYQMSAMCLPSNERAFAIECVRLAQKLLILRGINVQ